MCKTCIEHIKTETLSCEEYQLLALIWWYPLFSSIILASALWLSKIPKNHDTLFFREHQAGWSKKSLKQWHRAKVQSLHSWRSHWHWPSWFHPNCMDTRTDFFCHTYYIINPLSYKEQASINFRLRLRKVTSLAQVHRTGGEEQFTTT